MADNRRSKRLAYWLKHAPKAAGLDIDKAGWVPVEAILEPLWRSKLPTTTSELNALVASSDKQRFEISDDAGLFALGRAILPYPTGSGLSRLHRNFYSTEQP